MRKEEEKIQIAVCDYLRLQYPDVIFTSESSGLCLPIGLAKKAKRMRSSKGLPDLMIFAIKKYSNDAYNFRSIYNGLFIEIKTKRSDVYLKSGKMKKSEHIKEQSDIINRLYKKGYFATFGFGFEDCKTIIDWYLRT